MLKILLGLTAEPIFETFTRIMKHFGYTTLTALEAISLMWLREPSWVLGILGGLGISCWASLFMYYSAKVWGADYFPVKTMLIGMTTESLIFNIFGTLGRNEWLIQDVVGNYVHAGAAAIAGWVVGWLIKKVLF